MTGAEIQTLAFIIWMIGSMIAFVVILAWALWPGHRERFQTYAAIPLRREQGENHP
jgi:cbb3-type cytochrome oxidase subunit 3